MEVYEGPHLNLTYERENNRLINLWKSSPKTVQAFKQEMLELLTVLEKINPAQILWLQEKFTFKIDEETNSWAEKNIMIPRFKAGFIKIDQDGFHHVAFVVGRDVLAHIGVMDVFDKKSNNVFKPKHFATLKEAKNWLDNESEASVSDTKNENAEIIYKGIDTNGKAIIEIKSPSADIANTIASIKSILEENQFIKNNSEKYSSLSKREKETLKFIIQGSTNEQISEQMFISPHTVRTHRNRIWIKLDIKHFRDCLKYECFFN